MLNIDSLADVVFFSLNPRERAKARLYVTVSHVGFAIHGLIQWTME
jgi:hypothetical protein